MTKTAQRGLCGSSRLLERALVLAGNEPTQHDRNSLGLVWVVCEPNSSVVALGLTSALGKIRAQVQTSLSRPKIAPSSVMFCAEDAAGASEGVKGLRTLYPDSSILVFSVHADLSLAKAALREGAHGFVHAGMSPQQIVRAVEVTAEGELAFPRALLEYLMLNGAHTAGLDALSARQVETLEMVEKGLSNAEIGERLFLSESTIKQRLRTAYKVLGVRNRSEAAKLLRTSQA